MTSTYVGTAGRFLKLHSLCNTVVIIYYVILKQTEYPSWPKYWFVWIQSWFKYSVRIKKIELWWIFIWSLSRMDCKFQLKCAMCEALLWKKMSLVFWLQSYSDLAHKRAETSNMDISPPLSIWAKTSKTRPKYLNRFSAASHFLS